MKQKYLVWVAAISLLGQQAWGQATTWRPFRPGFVYSFAPTGSSATTASVHTLRVDSAYAAAGDSVYTFNRLLRLAGGSSSQYRKSRNNLLGARLRWQPGTSSYYLEANAEPLVNGATVPTTLLLRPRAAVGSTWVASTQPALTATVSSRSYGQVGTLSDSLATITLSNGQLLVISKHYGLVQGPQWLALDGSNSWRQWAAPRAGRGAADLQALFALGVGDELGYEITTYVFAAPIVCAQSYLLRRIVGRQLTADSLVLTYRQQMQTTRPAFAGCGPAGTTTTPVSLGRWAFSLRTGQSPQFPFLALLTDEYLPIAGSADLYRGRSVAIQPAGTSCQSSTETVSFVPMYPYQFPSGLYYGGVDDMATLYEFSASLGVGPLTVGSSSNYTNTLSYYSRGGVVCGSRLSFATLLPTRAALAAQVATLYPNPATEQATLTLAAPAPTGTTLTLADALGRSLWSLPVAAGQTTLVIPLAGRPAGLYLAQLSFPGQPPLTFKLTTAAN